MTDTVLNQILGDNYNILEQFQELQSLYFETPPDTSKLGIYGWLNEIMAHAMKKGIYHRNSLYPEFFPNSASLPSSIYNFAAIRDKLTSNAYPSKANIVFSFPLDRALLLGTDTNGSKVIKFKREDNYFLFGTFKFSTPHSFELRLRTLGTNTSVIANYITTESKIIDSAIFDYSESPYIKAVIDGNNILLSLDLYQYETRVREFKILSNNLSERLYFNVPYIDQLVNFNTFYTYNNQETLLPKYLNIYSAIETSQYVFYNYLDQDEYQIFFPINQAAFRPKFNSTIKTHTYTSKGAAGNFTYTGNVSFISSDERYTQSLTGVIVTKQPVGGKDRPSLLELKQEIFKAIKKVDSLASEDDLNYYFSDVASETFDSNSKVEFVRTRDDLLRREFTGYLLLTGENRYVLPTNTALVETNVQEIASRNMIIKTGSLVVYDSSIQRYRLLTTAEYPENYIINNKESFIYTIPFLLKISAIPFNRVTYINNFVNEDASTLYLHINPDIYREFIINRVLVNRNPVLTNECTIKCNVGVVSGNSYDNSKIMMVLRDYNTNEVYGYKEMVYNTLSEFHECSLNISDEFDNNDNMIIKNSLNSHLYNNIIPAVGIDEKILIEIAVFFNDNSSTVDVKPEYLSNITSLDGYRYVSLIKIKEPISFYSSLDDVIRSPIDIRPDQLIGLGSVPLLGASIFFNNRKFNNFMTNFSMYLSLFRQNFKRLGNNTSVNLKFFNSYGVSKYFDIDKTNLNLELSIKLTSGFSRDLDMQIKNTVVSYISGVNNSVDKIFAVSNIITLLQNTYTEIMYIRFDSLNRSSIFDIKPLYSEQELEEQKINNPPEYISIGIERNNTEIGLEDIPTIKINYL